VDSVFFSVAKFVAPIKDSRCAVVVPTHKCVFTPIERYCIEYTIRTLVNWDIFFLIPDGLDLSGFGGGGATNFIKLNREYFVSTDSYNKLRIGRFFHEIFFGYDRLLVVEPDAIVFSDEIADWHRQNFDYIGAPWFGRLSLKSSFNSVPEFRGRTLNLAVGNGGLCMINPRSIVYFLQKYDKLVSEFLLLSGSQAHSDAFFAFLGVIDEDFKIAPSDVASVFSLELDARQAISNQGRLPMGFHALYKYDRNLWTQIFPDAPNFL
jgi:Protein of unknown function (DUF5672)